MAPLSRSSLALIVLGCIIAAQGPASAMRVLAQDWQSAVNSLAGAATTLTKALQSSTATTSSTALQQRATAPQQAAAAAPAGTTTATFSGSGGQAGQVAAGSAAAGPVATGAQKAPKAVLVDLAPGASVGVADKDGYPRLSAAAPGSSVVVAQGPGSNPDVSFQLGPNDAPVKVTLGRQSALSGGVATSANAPTPAADESALSGSLDLGHYGVTQSNALESFAINTDGAELVTPFAKLQVPVKAFTTVGPNLAQQLPAQLAQLAKAFEAQSATAPAPAAPAPGGAVMQAAP